MAACADALFPAGGPIPVSGTEAGLVEYMDRYVARTPRPLRPYMRLLFHFVELSPWVFGPRRARFTRLPQADRIAVLASMAQSCIYLRRVTFLSLRTMLSMASRERQGRRRDRRRLLRHALRAAAPPGERPVSPPPRRLRRSCRG